MPTLQELRLEAGLSMSALARLTKLDRQTIERAERGTPVQDVKAYTIVRALGEKLGREIKLSDVDGLNIL